MVGATGYVQPVGEAKPADKVKNFVWVDAEEYEYLKGRDDELMMLENAGVDNWEWYSEALGGDL